VAELKEKYGFPLFTRQDTSVYLGNEKKLIISDIWAFLDYVIKKHNSNKWYLLSLLEQARNFYSAAEGVPLRSKPLLYYYSFLNLAKIILNLEYGYGNAAEYIHGLSERNNTSFQTSTITLQTISPAPRIKVASELLRLFNGITITANTTINLKSFLKHCVGIHRAYSEIYKQPEIFYKLEDIQYYRNGRMIGIKAKVRCKHNEVAALTAQGYNINTVDGIFYLSEELLTTRYNPAREDYYNLSRQYLNHGIWYYIGSKGYTTYISSEPHHRYSPEIVIYNTIFYLGSITRYRPDLFDEIFDATEQWLMSEFLTTQPKQFLYLATAKLLGQNVLKAYTSF
jgi:hypothetical protein